MSDRFAYHFTDEDRITLGRVLEAEWVISPDKADYGSGYRQPIHICVRNKGGGLSTIAWLPKGFPYGVAESLVEERNKNLRDR
jgi:hypothetical protein